jgi:hypothetical protein
VTRRLQVNEFGVGRQIKQFDGLRQQQHRRHREQNMTASAMTAQIAQESAG